jgi:ParB family chromosome partitioning protein
MAAKKRTKTKRARGKIGKGSKKKGGQKALAKRKAPTEKGSARRPREVPEYVEGLPARSTIRSVPLGEIDAEDTRFQFRLSPTTGDLRASIRTGGQQVPLLLWGSNPPYKIVDGFRRVAAIAEIGWDSVKAIIREDLTEQAAFALSFIENVKRKNYSPVDKANAIWQAIHGRGMKKEEVARELGLSVKQVGRYLKLLELDSALQQAVKRGRISMAHAAALHHSGIRDPARWIERIREEGLTEKQLRRRLKKAGRGGRPKLYLNADGKGGFRMYPFRYRSEMGAAEKKRIIDALERALKLLKRG